MGYTFTPPTYVENINSPSRLLSRFKIDRGYTVLKTGGSYETVSYPDQLMLRDADVVYLGGHTYEVSSAEAAALTAAGYTVVGP